MPSQHDRGTALATDGFIWGYSQGKGWSGAGRQKVWS
jgi:hypothetical protein